MENSTVCRPSSAATTLPSPSPSNAADPERTNLGAPISGFKITRNTFAFYGIHKWGNECSITVNVSIADSKVGKLWLERNPESNSLSMARVTNKSFVSLAGVDVQQLLGRYLNNQICKFGINRADSRCNYLHSWGMLEAPLWFRIEVPQNTMMMGADIYETEAEIVSMLADGKVPIGVGQNTRIR
ncbi:hypothetical protein ZIOFF_050260 [Zingiber officinale]|uniref:Uncharacterized protein n=1 Tax=Zingiber officinale TaxID=94328 RepID=A0A8J5KR81_ZINOF|nr:hypothetical protein ZIOFF_050260 [Zingiber officinale]